MWRNGAERIVVTRLVGIRSAVLLFIIVANWLIPDYDTSTALLDESEATSWLDHFLLVTLRPFSHWDAVYFTHVSKNITYPYEHMHAFFPALPIILYALREYLFAPILHALELICPVESFRLSERAMTLVLGVLVNQVASMKAAVELYRLTYIVYAQSTTLHATYQMAFTSAMLFCISPATIFFCAIYSEALYACFTFWGLRVLGELYSERFMLDTRKTGYGKEAWELWRSGLLLAVTVGVRSTGFTYALFFAFYLLFRFPWKQILTFKIPLPFTRFVVVCIVLAVNGLMLALPLVSYQYVAYRNFCSDSNPNRAMSPWCQEALPNVYNYVQGRYWNVGLFRYYQVHQIPNFILASPTLVLCCAGIGVFLYSWFSPRHRWLQYYVKGAIPFVLHWICLTGTAFAILHIQVVTRFMSATPPLYWFMAALVLAQKGPRSPLWFNQPLLSFSVVVFSLAYLVVGSVLHTNFYPWT